MLVIGSTALQKLGYKVEPKDLDLVCTHEESQAFIKATRPKVCYPLTADVMFLRYEDGQICEIEIAWPDSKAEKLLKFAQEQTWYAWCDITNIRGWACHVPTLDLLYVLKLSHRYKKDSPHFLKTMQDIRWMREKDCEKALHIPGWREFLKQREKDTYTYSHPKLKVDKATFFDETATGVKYTYDHDSIHRAIALTGAPAYLSYAIDGEEVLCSKEKFFDPNMGEFWRLAGVVEESMVLALERSLIPFPGKKTPEEAFLFALQKVCTSITSGWFREYAWSNYDKAVALYKECDDGAYVQNFEKGLETGVVLKVEEA